MADQPVVEAPAEHLAVDPSPHVVSREEFEDDHGWKCITIYYYEDDGVLADDRKQPVRDMIPLVGHDIASKFGRDPDDPDIVLISCPRLETYFEVCRVEGSYLESVLAPRQTRVVRHVED
jgi:hypothetical protein